MGNGAIKQRVENVLGVAGIMCLVALFIGIYGAALTWAQVPGPSPVLGLIAALLAVWGPWGLYLIISEGKPVSPPLTALAALASALIFGLIWWLSLAWTADDSAHVEISFLTALGVVWMVASVFFLWRKSRGRD